MNRSIDQSYLVVEPDTTSAKLVIESHQNDPFNRFWETVENLIQKISVSNPVAFTTAPLHNEPVSSNLHLSIYV
jgi:hypothetical protein